MSKVAWLGEGFKKAIITEQKETPASLENLPKVQLDSEVQLSYLQTGGILNRGVERKPKEKKEKIETLATYCVEKRRNLLGKQQVSRSHTSTEESRAIR